MVGALSRSSRKCPGIGIKMNGYSVKKIPSKLGKSFIKKYHYSRGCHNGPMTWGLFFEDDLVGVIAFATPCSEAVRASVFGTEHKDRVTELHRLVVLPQDNRPRNLTSWFVARALRLLLAYRPDLRAVISFADTTEGHYGGIYRSLNFIHCGMTGSSTFWRDQEGVLRHPRQNGRNISKEQAVKLGWTAVRRHSKHRFVLVIAETKREKRKWSKLMRYKKDDL